MEIECNWKAKVSRTVDEHLKGKVLENVVKEMTRDLVYSAWEQGFSVMRIEVRRERTFFKQEKITLIGNACKSEGTRYVMGAEE